MNGRSRSHASAWSGVTRPSAASSPTPARRVIIGTSSAAQRLVRAAAAAEHIGEAPPRPAKTFTKTPTWAVKIREAMAFPRRLFALCAVVRDFFYFGPAGGWAHVSSADVSPHPTRGDPMWVVTAVRV